MTKDLLILDTGIDYFKNLPFPILLVENSGLIRYCNTAAEQLLLSSSDQIIGRSWPGLDAQLTLIHWRKKWKNLSQNSRSISYDTSLVIQNDKLLQVSITLCLLNKEYAAILIEDITLSIAQEHQIQLLSTQSSSIYWRYDCQSKVFTFSKNLHQQLQLSNTEFPLTINASELKDRITNLIRDQNTSKLFSLFKEAIQKGDSFEIDLISKAYHQLTITAIALKNDLHTAQVIGTISTQLYKKPEKTIDSNMAKFSLDYAMDMILWMKVRGPLTYVNHELCRRLGYSEEELLQMDITDFVIDTTPEERRAHWRELKEKRYTEQEVTFLTKTGEAIPICVFTNLINFEAEQMVCCYFRDLTLRKKRDRRRALLEMSLDSANDIILWIRPNNVIQYANEAFVEFTGKDIEEIEGQNTLKFFSNATPESQIQFWEKLREEQDFDAQTTLKAKSGKTVPFKASFNYINRKGEEFCCVFLRNWAKNKKRDLALMLSRLSLENAEEIIVWLDKDATIQYINTAMIKYLGGHADDWIDKSMNQVFPQLSLEDFTAQSSLEYSMPSVDGHTIYLELNCKKIIHEGVLYYMIAGRNFTERFFRRQQIKEAQQKIEELSKRLEAENVLLRAEVYKSSGVANIITVSSKYQKVLSKLSQVAATDATVLISGETGTGKELLARAAHSLSERDKSSLIKVNCAALPENLIESELFGHEKGAFTGAQERKIGRFELANNGTIFLDEVGELPLSLQPKLLRVLQEGEFERVGGTTTIKVDVRLIAATNRQLKEMVQAGQFRADLYYRLNVFPIENIPLRDRPEDIPILTDYFAKRFAKKQGKVIKKINAKDLQKLQTYRFPGNVRELENIVERAMVLCNGEVLNISFEKESSLDLNANVFHTFDEMQRKHIIAALKRTSGRVTGLEGAARILGLKDQTLVSKIRKFKIQKTEYLL